MGICRIVNLVLLPLPAYFDNPDVERSQGGPNGIVEESGDQ